MNRLWQRILSLIAPGTMTISDDTGAVLRTQLKINYMEIRDGVPVMQHFGFASVPPVGSDAVAIFISGDRSNGVIVATGDQATRPTGKQVGETVIYNAHGMSIFFGAGGITIDGGGKDITITNAPTVIQNGDLHVTGTVVGGYGGSDQVGLATHRHGTGSAAAGTVAPTAGT